MRRLRRSKVHNQSQSLSWMHLLRSRSVSSMVSVREAAQRCLIFTGSGVKSEDGSKKLCQDCITSVRSMTSRSIN
jgi:hypothetical protein